MSLYKLTDPAGKPVHGGTGTWDLPTDTTLRDAIAAVLRQNIDPDDFGRTDYAVDIADAILSDPAVQAALAAASQEASGGLRDALRAWMENAHGTEGRDAEFRLLIEAEKWLSPDTPEPREENR